MEGYHSPQVDVDVRLNTNEAPEPPPGRVRATRWPPSCRRASTGTATPTGPPPRCGPRIAELARRPRRAGVRGQRLQRGAADAAARLRRRRPHGRSRSSRPTRCTRHIARVTGTAVVEGERARRLHARPRRGRRGSSPSVARPSRSSARPTTRPGMVETSATVEAVLEADRGVGGLLVVDEAYGQFAPWSALELVDDDRAARRHPHLLEDVVDGRGPPRLPRRPDVGGRASSRRSCCRTTSTPLKQLAGHPRPRLRRRDARRGSPSLVEERGRLVAALARPPRRAVAVGRQLRPVPPRRPRRRRGVAGAGRPVGPRPQLLVVAPPRRLPAGHARHAATRTIASSPPSRRSLAHR